MEVYVIRDNYLKELFDDDPEMLRLIADTSKPVQAFQEIRPDKDFFKKKHYTEVPYWQAENETESIKVSNRTETTYKKNAVENTLKDAVANTAANSTASEKPAGLKPAGRVLRYKRNHPNEVSKNPPGSIAFNNEAVSGEVAPKREKPLPVYADESIQTENFHPDIERELAHPKKIRSKVLKLAGDIFFLLICVAIVGGSVLFAFSSNPDKSIFGFRFYNVLSNSMTPSEGSPDGGFYEGDLIIVKLCEPESVNVGDVITFVPGRDSTAYLTHRVIEIKDTANGNEGLYFVTKGDANKSEDPPIPSELLIGKKVFTIPQLGTVLNFVQKNLILSLVLVLSVFALIAVLRMYIKQSKKEKEQRKMAVAL